MVENKRPQQAVQPIMTFGTVSCTTRNGKDSEIQRIAKVASWQKTKVRLAFNESCEMGKTMLMVARETGVERASICRRVAELREAGLLWECGKHICKVSKSRAMHYTTNYRICLNHFIQVTKHVWVKYGMCVQVKLWEAIKAYVVEHKIDMGIFGLDSSEVRDIWEKEVKPIIDGELR